ncbi:hypothetical protein P9112_006981 [Eukaryota sp. TZLM1-RC]
MDDEIIQLMLSPTAERNLHAFLLLVPDLEVVNNALQERNLSIADVITIIDAQHKDYPTMNHYISVGAAINEEFGLFENAVLKVRGGEEQSLTLEEAESLTRFRKDVNQEDVAEVSRKRTFSQRREARELSKKLVSIY